MRSRAWRSDRGFTLIELLIVVAIIGILAAIAIPNLISALQKGRQKRSMSDIRTLGLAVEIYNTDYGFYPRIDGVAADLGDSLTPGIVKVIPRIDGWSRDILFASDGKTYTLVSHGANGTADTPYIPGATHRFDDDIVHTDGMFLQWPEGVQAD